MWASQGAAALALQQAGRQEGRLNGPAICKASLLLLPAARSCCAPYLQSLPGHLGGGDLNDHSPKLLMSSCSSLFAVAVEPHG